MRSNNCTLSDAEWKGGGVEGWLGLSPQVKWGVWGLCSALALSSYLPPQATLDCRELCKAHGAQFMAARCLAATDTQWSLIIVSRQVWATPGIPIALRSRPGDCSKYSARGVSMPFCLRVTSQCDSPCSPSNSDNPSSRGGSSAWSLFWFLARLSGEVGERGDGSLVVSGGGSPDGEGMERATTGGTAAGTTGGGEAARGGIGTACWGCTIGKTETGGAAE
eukprot:Hpha_TRINITY_DN2511_c0_g1::TRINITY_DN2511_c0_g1_i1::g.1454::m.1454